MPNYIDEAGGLLRRLIGDLAGDTDVYVPTGVVKGGNSKDFPGVSLLSGLRASTLPDGTEVGLVSPYELIKRSYPGDLGTQAVRRTLNSPMQKPYQPLMNPLFVRPGEEISPKLFGRRVSTFNPASEELNQIMDVAGGHDDAFRTLLHEARHATQHNDLATRPALRSISSYKAKSLDGMQLTDVSRRYLAQPDELLTFLGEVGDDFVKKHGRLIETAGDAKMAIDMMEAGEAMPELHPLAKQLYAESYRNNPTAREHINRVLTRYFAVPGAIGAGAAMSGDTPADEKQY